MNEKGFISSALLYGMLALFIILMTSTIYILGNNKLGIDKLKQNALTSVENGYIKADKLICLYDGTVEFENNIWKDLSRNKKDANTVNVAKVDNHLSFNNNAYINTNIKQQDLGSKFTIMTTFKINNFRNYNYLLRLYKENKSLNIYTINNHLRICYINGVSKCSNIGRQYLNNKTNLALVMKENTGFDIYVNGSLFDKLDINATFDLSDQPLYIGKNNDNYFIGDLYNFIVYNDGLTDTDVKNNFNIDNNKYKILTN